MTSKVSGGWDINWKLVREIVTFVGILAIITTVVVSLILLGVSEGNGMVIYGSVSLVVGIAVYFELSLSNTISRFGLHAWPAAFFLFFLVSPFLHFADKGKVWIVDGKTTLGNSFLVRLPFMMPTATSVTRNQDARMSLVASTKEGVPVRGTVTGDFRLTDDENEIISRLGTAEDPDMVLRAELKEIMSRAFSNAIARRSVADISVSNNFALDVDVGTATAVKQLGLRRNGIITVSGLQPYFMDR